MKIPRYLLSRLAEQLRSQHKILLLYGARQTGKTTLSEDILAQFSERIFKVNADELKYTDILSSRDLNKLKLLTEGYDILFIDEAQRISNIGINLKLLHDNIPNLKLLVTGSSSLDLANQVKEPLTGRSLTYTLFPISMMELRKIYNPIELQGRLEEFMIYGQYPEVLSLSTVNQKLKYLRELTSSYLYKDIFEITTIRNRNKVKNLLKLLALQIGSEASLNEIANKLQLSQETVSAYINLLEKSYVLFRLSGFRRTLRNEISKKDKIYFWDLGVRNALIDNFSFMDSRNDVGAMWENLMIAERLKYLSYSEIYCSSYFWRTYSGSEIDYVEECDGELFAYEIKYNKPKKRPPKGWVENYSNNYTCISKDNFWEFIT